MSKMNDMAMTIVKLRNAAAAIADAADWLAKQFSGNAAEQPPTEEVAAKPEPKPKLTLEQARAVLAGKSRAGHTAAVRELFRNMEPACCRRLTRQITKPS